MQFSLNFHGSARHEIFNSTQKNKKSRSKSKGYIFTQGDRVIPQCTNISSVSNYQCKEPTTANSYQQLLYSQLYTSDQKTFSTKPTSKDKILRYHNAIDVSEFNTDTMTKRRKVFDFAPQGLIMNNKNQWQKHLIFTLEAPGVLDDFATQPIDWSSLNFVVLAAKENLFAYNFQSKQVVDINGAEYFSTSQYTAVKWSNAINELLISGNKCGLVEFWDMQYTKKIAQSRVARFNSSVTNISVAQNIIATAIANSQIDIYDTRERKTIFYLTGHDDSVLGVKFQNDYPSYLASCGADSNVLLWDLRSIAKPIYQLSGHQGPVKALDWSPRRTNLLATGGGSKDRRIIFWDIATGEKKQQIQTNSQITSIVFGDPENEQQELYTAHGGDENSVKIWKIKNPHLCEFNFELKDHTSRVLAVCLNKNGDTLCSVESNEKMKFWDVNQKKKNKSHESNLNNLSQFIELNR